MLHTPLPRSFYTTDGCTLARDCLGKLLVYETDAGILSGIITETEAYMGVVDRASHAYGGRQTARNETMYRQEDCLVLVAREGETILGTVSGFCCRGLAGSFLAIEDLIVREDLRGGGIGTKLMDTLHQFGKASGCCYAILVSSGFRKQAHHFYEKIGYVEEVRGFRKDL